MAGINPSTPTYTSRQTTPSTAHTSTAPSLHGTVHLISADGRIIHLPVPSSDINDPLNWSFSKRLTALFAIGIYSVVGLVLVQGASLNVAGLSRDFESVETPDLDHLGIDKVVLMPTLFMGLGCFLWIPLTLAVGRRPVLLLGSVLMLLATIGAAVAKSLVQLLVAVSVIGLAEGLSLSVVLLIIIDVTFIHQRPAALAGVWSVVSAVAVWLLTAVPSITNHGLEWRHFYLAWIGPTAFSLVLNWLFCRETFFKRPAVAFDGRILIQSPAEILSIYPATVSTTNTNIYADSTKLLPSTPNQHSQTSLLHYLKIVRAPAASGWLAMAHSYPQILICFANPLIFWVTLLNATCYAGMLFIGSTYPSVLTSPPYTLTSSPLIGANLCCGAGSLLAWPASGPLVSHIMKRLARRCRTSNRGVREAEHYLVAYILPVLACCISTLLYGLAVQRQWHYSVIYIAYGMNGFGFVALAIANTLWVTEAFPMWAAPALVVVGGGSYVLSFGIGFVLGIWIEGVGFGAVGWQLSVVQGVLGCGAVPAAFWGREARGYVGERWGRYLDGALRPQ